MGAIFQFITHTMGAGGSEEDVDTDDPSRPACGTRLRDSVAHRSQFLLLLLLQQQLLLLLLVLLLPLEQATPKRPRQNMKSYLS